MVVAAARKLEPNQRESQVSFVSMNHLWSRLMSSFSNPSMQIERSSLDELYYS